MGIEVRSLVFDNLITYETKQLKENWQDAFNMMEDFQLNQDIYKNGPVFFSFKPEKDGADIGKFTYYLPINGPVRLTEEADFHFLEKLNIEKALVLRQADEEVNFSAAYQKVKDYASGQRILLEETFFCVLLDVYGEYIIDLYVPVIERGDA